MDIAEIKKRAIKELEDERFRKAVENYKEKLKNKKNIWDRLFPYKITITKKEK